MNNFFIDNFNIIEDAGIINESLEDGTPSLQKISGIFMQAEKENRNRRIYSRDTLYKAVEEYQEIIQDGDSYGALDHPDNLEMKFNEASHLITKLEMVGNDVYGEAVIFTDTPSGKIIDNIFKTKKAMGKPIKVGISSRGAGRLVKRDNNSYVENYKLIAVDLVCRPSAQDAYVSSMLESQYMYDNGILKKVNNIKESDILEFLSNYSKIKRGLTNE